jgi:hypothetical protein
MADTDEQLAEAVERALAGDLWCVVGQHYVDPDSHRSLGEFMRTAEVLKANGQQIWLCYGCWLKDIR